MAWRGERAKVGPRRGLGDVAHLTFPPDAPAPSVAFLRHCLEVLAAEGFREVLTGALSPGEQQTFLAVGFEEQERLRLLTRDLSHLPTLPPVALRRARPRDRPQALAVDAVSFSPFWRLDEDGLDEALGATPRARFRVALDDGGSVAGYAVSGRAGPNGYLQRLAVLPDHRRRGFGRALVVDGLRWMRLRGVRQAVVNTQLDNDRALRLYLSLGFRVLPSGLAVLRRSLPA